MEKVSEDNFRPMPKKAKKKKATKKTLKRTPLKKKSAKKKPKKPKRVGPIKARCDKLWSELIRREGKCEICGTTESLQAHHLITRARLPTRYMKENGVCLCAYHHTYSHELSAHGNPLAFSRWFIENYGEERELWLQEQARNPEKWNLAKYEETEKELKMMLGR